MRLALYVLLILAQQYGSKPALQPDKHPHQRLPSPNFNVKLFSQAPFSSSRIYHEHIAPKHAYIFMHPISGVLMLKNLTAKPIASDTPRRWPLPFDNQIRRFDYSKFVRLRDNHLRIDRRSLLIQIINPLVPLDKTSKLNPEDVAIFAGELAKEDCAGTYTIDMALFNFHSYFSVRGSLKGQHILHVSCIAHGGVKSHTILLLPGLQDGSVKELAEMYAAICSIVKASM
ncbi:hypothetical protein GGI43DRAFT_388486 [Trichoderma evansii]